MKPLFVRYHESPRVAALQRREFYHDLAIGAFLCFALVGSAWLALR